MPSSRSKSSRWERTETYSPAPMEKAPASIPATPAMRMFFVSWLAPATPMMREKLETRPSLTPKTAARNDPPVSRRCHASPFRIDGPPPSMLAKTFEWTCSCRSMPSAFASACRA